MIINWKIIAIFAAAVWLTACGPSNNTVLKNQSGQSSTQTTVNSTTATVGNAKDVRWISYQNGHLQYGQDAQGNRIPDFSYAGYQEGGVSLPKAPVKQTVSPSGSNEDTSAIQQAIDAVAKLPLDANGLRGAVLLQPGTYHLAGSLQISQSGVVLRGSGSGDGGTLLVAEGKTRTVVTLAGTGKRQQSGGTAHVIDDYVPVGASSLHVDSPAGLAVGDHVIVQRPLEQNWIQAIGMDKIPPRPGAKEGTHWSPGAGLQFDRTITAIQGNQITLNVPLTNALEKNYTHATVWKYEFPDRISGSGMEDLAMDGNAFTQNADYKSSGFFNSQLIAMDNVQDGWLRNVVSHHFGQPFVVGSGAIRVTISSCSALEMAVPQEISDQPAAFSVSGQLILVENCKATGSNYHAWVTQAAVPGPNVFSRDSAVNTGSRKLDGGPHQRWATGILFEGITMSSDGNLELMDRSWMGTGQGYAGANSVLWNCSVGTFRVDNPPTAHNWAFGVKGKQQTDASHQTGEIVSLNQSVQPDSLYDEQLSERR